MLNGLGALRYSAGSFGKKPCCLHLDDKYVEREDFLSYGLHLAAEFAEEIKRVTTHRSLDSVTISIWRSSDPGWIKVNADWVVDSDSGDVASGRVLRDDCGQ
ncbi:hypothetical protein V6N11_040265 [Hibiscus sabdariffa]|uniref:Uncharacterized protein n=1 Tax=Hibiscus sabdariffa TaxID=183260 RepID=A0ABR2RGX6_9ROSI